MSQFSIACGTVIATETGEYFVTYDVSYFASLTQQLAAKEYDMFRANPRLLDFIELLHYDRDASKFLSRKAIIVRLYNGTGRSFDVSCDGYDDLIGLLSREVNVTTGVAYEIGSYDVDEGVGMVARPVYYDDLNPQSYSEDISYCAVQEYDGTVGIASDEEEALESITFTVGDEKLKIPRDKLLTYVKAFVMMGAEVAMPYAREYIDGAGKLEYDPYYFGYCYFAMFRRETAMVLLNCGRPLPRKLNREWYMIIENILRGGLNVYAHSVKFKLKGRNLHIRDSSILCDGYYITSAEILWRALPDYFRYREVGANIFWEEAEDRFLSV